MIRTQNLTDDRWNTDSSSSSSCSSSGRMESVICSSSSTSTNGIRRRRSCISANSAVVTHQLLILHHLLHHHQLAEQHPRTTPVRLVLIAAALSSKTTRHLRGESKPSLTHENGTTSVVRGLEAEGLRGRQDLGRGVDLEVGLVNRLGRGRFVRRRRGGGRGGGGCCGVGGGGVLLLLWLFVGGSGGGLEVALLLLVLASGFPVLEPVEDVGVAYLAELLELGSDFPYLVSRRVHHSGVEYGFQDPDLFRFRVPPRFWLWSSFFAPGHCLISQQTNTQTLKK